MPAFDPVDLAAAALFACSLAVVLCEIAVRSPRSLLEMLADSRAFAERPLAGANTRRAVPSPWRPSPICRPPPGCRTGVALLEPAVGRCPPL